MKFFNRKINHNNNNNHKTIEDEIFTIQKTYYVAQDGSYFENREECELKNHYLNFKLWDKKYKNVKCLDDCYYFLIKDNKDIEALNKFGSFRMCEILQDNNYAIGLYVKNPIYISTYYEFTNITQQRKIYTEMEQDFLSNTN